MSHESTTQIVYEAAVDLHNQEQEVTRERVADATGLKMTIVDDRMGHLVDVGMLYRAQRGVYRPIPQHPPARTMSKTLLPDGTANIEIGDDHVLILTPKEQRALGDLVSASGYQFSMIELGQQTAYENALLKGELKTMRREIESLKKRHK